MNNPIITRELLGTFRTNRALAVQIIFVVALAALVLIRWPSEVQVSGAESQQMLRVFGYGLLTALLLLAPVFPATSIVREKQQGTLALLLNSPMTAWDIALGKLVGSLGFLLLLIVLSLPAAAACFAMGGIGYNQVGQMYVVLVMLSLMYTTLGLLVSSYANNTESALRITYGIILLMAIITLGPNRFLVGSGASLGTAVLLADWLSNLSPFPAMMQVMGDTAVGSAGLVGSGGAMMKFTIVSVVCSTGFMIWTTSRLNQRIFDRARDAGTITDERSSGQQAYRRIMYLWFFDPQRRSDLIGFRPLSFLGALIVACVMATLAFVWFSGREFPTDPIVALPMVAVGVVPGFIGLAALMGAFWTLLNGVPTAVKEQKTNRFGRGNWMMRLIGGCLIISLGLMFLTTTQSIGWGVETLGGIMVLLQVALVILITPTLASGLISSERESGGWALLQMTPLSSVSIVAGKLLSVIWTLVLLLAATLPAYGVLIVIDPGQSTVALQVMLSLALTAAMALLVSAAISSVFKHTAGATATSYTTLVALCAGTLLFWLAEDAPFAQSTVEWVLMVNPLAGALNVLETPGFSHYNLLPANWWIMAGICAVSLLVLVVQTWRLTRPR